MRDLLEQRNRTLLREVGLLRGLLAAAEVPAELAPYRQRLLQVCNELEAQAQLNLAYLGLMEDSVLAEVLSNTQNALAWLQLLSSRLATPVLRAASSDRLCLAVVGWLHSQHPETIQYPPVFADGVCSVWPLESPAPMYFFPSMEQLGLLHQPLLFHEFGHLLYARHKPEMDDLVGELRRRVYVLLMPASQRNDAHATEQAKRRLAIANGWYMWTQELFCDAVGLLMAGPCFLRSFSAYLGTLDPGHYYRTRSDLEASEHPVTWLRVRLLAARARSAGFGNVAGAVEQEWAAVAKAMGIQEDYHGFYDPSLGSSIAQTIDDMLTEAAPRPCTPTEASGANWDPAVESPVRLLNWSWQVYLQRPSEYADWEAQQIRLLLERAQP